MNRAAILPFPGDPYLIKYWMRFFKDIWYDEVDMLYVYHNSTIEKDMEKYIARICTDPKITYLYNSNQVEHGTAIDNTLNHVKEKYLMLVEDDAFIFKKGIVDNCFKMLESGNYSIVGSKRGSCSMEILEQAQKKWGLNYEGEGDQGCNFWPCYFFIETEVLKLTTRRFCSRAWTQGEIIEPLSYEVEADIVNGDTFVNTSLELRAMIDEHRIAYVPQYHANPYDLEFFEKGLYLFNGAAPWTHIGSLSSGVGGVLRDNVNRPLVRRTVDHPNGETIIGNHCNTEEEKKEWERRVAFWLNAWEYAVDDRGTKSFYFEYGRAIDRVIEQYGLRKKTVNRFQRVYKTLGL